VLNLLKPAMRILLIAGLSASVAACGGAISGNDYFEEEETGDAKPSANVFGSILGGLGGTTNQRRIEHKPRSPLVIPPSRDLPPTEEKIARGDPANWPNDPDLAEAKLREEWAKNSDGKTPFPGADATSKRSDPGYVAKHRVKGGGLRDYAKASSGNDATESRNFVMSPDKLRSLKVKTPEAVEVDENGVPIRRYLTEPPTAYRVPSADAPMEVPEYTDEELGLKRNPSREKLNR